MLTPVAQPGVPILAAALGALVAMRVTPSTDPGAGDLDAPVPRPIDPSRAVTAGIRAIDWA